MKLEHYMTNYRPLRKTKSMRSGPPQGRPQRLWLSAKLSPPNTYILTALYEVNRFPFKTLQVYTYMQERQ